MKKEENNVFAKYKEQVNEALNDIKTKGRRHRQIPNILTVMRLMAPFFIIPTAFLGNVPLMLGLVAGFSLTDLADGFIARHFNLTSELGKDLDAVCDKVFAGTLLLAASFTNPILLCNLALEGTIAGVNSYKKINGENVSSSQIGRVKTWALFSLIGAGMLSSFLDMSIILNPLVVVTSIMQGLTISSYLTKKDKPKASTFQKQYSNKDVTTIKEDKEIVQGQTKELERQTINTESPNKVEKLKEMKELLLQEKEHNTYEDVKVYQKTNKNDTGKK